MIRPTRLALRLLALAVALTHGAAFAATSTAPEPQFGSFSPADLDVARAHAEAAKLRTDSALESGCVDSDEPPLRSRATRSQSPLAISLTSEDPDAVHYARGHTLVFHVFIDHNLGSWSTTERNAAAAKAALAKQWYVDEAPADANMDFDNLGGTGYYYYQTASLNINADTLSNAEIQIVIASFGFTDDNGDGDLRDDFSLFWQNWNGGYDNVIVVYQPADAVGRASASLGVSRITHYTDDA